MSQELTGWSRTAPTRATVVSPTTPEALAATLADVGDRGVIARGLGRSYGDAAQNAGGAVADATGVRRLLAFDGVTGLVTAESGLSFDDLLRVVVPQGWFVPVSPGTRHVTVGGAIAADVHGKNHHRDGSFVQHVRSLRLRTPAGVIEVGPDEDPDLFWATAGGMGLTGVILDATFALQPITSSRLLVDTERTADLDDAFDRMTRGDHGYHYSVAWIDLVATGAAMGRSVLTRGDFAPVDALSEGDRGNPLAYDPSVLVTAPPWVPNLALNRLSVRAFNEFWYRKHPRHRMGELQAIPSFFHPLDFVKGWNRIYGSRGFLQWQMVVPFGAEATLRGAVEALSGEGRPSFLAVLKRFGESDPGPLSFPMAGWTLALDIPAGDATLGPLLDRLDRDVAEAGGRIYLAKDSRLDPALLATMYPRLDEWREIRARVDPDQALQSDLARRLDLL
ncbi:MAG: FAD-binding oxidoreductase [Acidimicrobiales bacterium]